MENKINFTPLQKIATSGGEVLKAYRNDEPENFNIQEIYFSKLNPKAIRAWKLHEEMTVNAVVPYGQVKFVIATQDSFEEFSLGPDHEYGRLSIPPQTWFGFQAGLNGGLVLNLANILHDPAESITKPIDSFKYAWDLI